MKLNSSKQQRHRETSLEARLAEYFPKLPQPSADFDRRLFDRIAQESSRKHESLTQHCN